MFWGAAFTGTFTAYLPFWELLTMSKCPMAFSLTHTHTHLLTSTKATQMPEAMGFPSLREPPLSKMAFISILFPATLVSRV